jgi:hypothetical protein
MHTAHISLTRAKEVSRPSYAGPTEVHPYGCVAARPQFVSAVWAQDSAEQAIVAEHIRNLEASGFFGEGQPLMTAVVPRPPLAFTAAAAPARGELKRIRADDPKLYKKLKAERQLYANAHFGFVQFCKDKVRDR